MANLSAIKLPNGVTYNLVDNTSGYLTTHQTLYEEKIEWGPTSISKVGSVSPIGMALSSEHSANRLAFINGDALTFEYSSNGGSTYTNYNYAKADKTAFCTTSYGVPIGRTSGNYTTSSRTRITLTAQNGTTGYVYTNPRKLLINISSSGGMQVLIEYRTGTNYQNNGSWSTFGTYNLSGWSGWNDIPLVLGTLGGGTTQTGNNWQLRLTFIMTSVNSSYPTTAHVNSIRLFGENGWQTTSNLGSSGHLYSYDVNQNAFFPAQITATQFNGNVTGSAGSVAWSNVSGKPTATGSSATGITASTTATKTTLGTAFTIPNVTGVGSASNWVFEDVACDDITSWSAGSGSASISGAVDSSDSTQLNITISHTHTAPSLSYTAKTASHVKSGGNGSAPTLGTAFTVPNVTGNTSATVSITDPKHTHTLS